MFVLPHLSVVILAVAIMRLSVQGFGNEKGKNSKHRLCSKMVRKTERERKNRCLSSCVVIAQPQLLRSVCRQVSESFAPLSRSGAGSQSLLGLGSWSFVQWPRKIYIWRVAAWSSLGLTELLQVCVCLSSLWNLRGVSCSITDGRARRIYNDGPIKKAFYKNRLYQGSMPSGLTGNPDSSLCESKGAQMFEEQGIGQRGHRRLRLAAADAPAPEGAPRVVDL